MFSLREISPAEEHARLRQRRRARAEDQIAFNGRCFLLLELLAGGTYGFVQLAPLSPSWPPNFSTFAVLTAIAIFLAAALFSLYFAGRAAVVVFSNFDLLETAWIAIGFAPWAVLMFAMTFLLSLMIPY